MHAPKRAWTWTTNKLYMYYDLEFFALTIVFNGITFHFCEHMAICVFVLCLHTYFFFFVVISLIHIILSLGFECDAQAKIRFRLLSHSNIFSKRFERFLPTSKKETNKTKKKRIFLLFEQTIIEYIAEKKNSRKTTQKSKCFAHKITWWFCNREKWKEMKWKKKHYISIIVIDALKSYMRTSFHWKQY